MPDYRIKLSMLVSRKLILLPFNVIKGVAEGDYDETQSGRCRILLRGISNFENFRGPMLKAKLPPLNFLRVQII